MDEEKLDLPLPLRSDNEWQHYSPVLPPPHYIPNCGKENGEKGKKLCGP